MATIKVSPAAIMAAGSLGSLLSFLFGNSLAFLVSSFYLCSGGLMLVLEVRGKMKRESTAMQ